MLQRRAASVGTTVDCGGSKQWPSDGDGPLGLLAARFDAGIRSASIAHQKTEEAYFFATWLTVAVRLPLVPGPVDFLASSEGGVPLFRQSRRMRRPGRGNAGFQAADARYPR